MKANDKVEVFDMYKAMKLPFVYEEFSTITIIDHVSELPLITSIKSLRERFGGT